MIIRRGLGWYKNIFFIGRALFESSDPAQSRHQLRIDLILFSDFSDYEVGIVVLIFDGLETTYYTLRAPFNKQIISKITGILIPKICTSLL